MHKITEARYPDSGLFDAGFENACRNPDGESDIWCYTMNPTKLWETCLPLVDPVIVVPTSIEAMTGRGMDYRGAQKKTKTGKDCIRWDSGEGPITPGKYPDSGLTDNFCRNPDDSPTIWCRYSRDKWEYCEPLAE